MLKAMKGTADIAGHGEVDRAFGIIPIKGQATVLVAVPVGGNGVDLPETSQEVLGIEAVDVFHTEVVDHQRKGDRPGVMAEKARSVRGGRVSMAFKVDL
jgi:hypothetical protein